MLSSVRPASDRLIDTENVRGDVPTPENIKEAISEMLEIKHAA